MSYFEAKKHQIQFQLGLCPRPRWGAYSDSPDPLAGFKSPTLLLRGGRKGEGEGKGRKKKRDEGKGKGRASRIFSSVCWQPYESESKKSERMCYIVYDCDRETVAVQDMG